MRIFKRLLIALLFLSGCGTQSIAPVPKATIQGQVFFANRNDSLVDPIMGANVFTNPSTDTVKTDSQGRYVIDVSPGRYTVIAINNSDSSNRSDTITAISGRADTVNLFFAYVFVEECKKLQSEISDAMGCMQPSDTFTKTSTVVSKNGLSLTLSIDSTTYQPGQQISVTISEKNALAAENSVKTANEWLVQGLNVGPCGPLNYPFGIAVLQGNYDIESVASVTPLDLYDPNATYHCPMILAGITAYDFQPSSDVAAIYTSFNFGPFDSIQMTSGVASAGYWVGSPAATFRNFIPGIYTVVGGDEWGALVVLHFVIS